MAVDVRASATVGRLLAVLATAALAAVVQAGVAAQAVRTDSPTATITSLQQGLIEAARNPAASLDERYRALEPLIVATHDLSYIAEFALRRQWSALSAPDRQRFVAAFERLSIMTYAARFKTVAGDTFRPVSEAAPDASGRVAVTTAAARANQPDVSLEYLLHQADGGWRIINVVADGVSDLALKRAEYQRLYTSGGIAGLLTALEEQTRRLERD